MNKKYASLALIAILSFLLGCATFFFVVAPMAAQPSVEPEEILLQETIPALTEPTAAPETEPVETVPPTEPMPTVPIPEDVDLDMTAWLSPSVIRGYISTWDQALDLVRFRNPVLYHGNAGNGWGLGWTSGSDTYGYIFDGGIIAGDTPGSPKTRTWVPEMMTYWLSDNMEIYTCYAFWHLPDSAAGRAPLLSINCIKTASGYEFRNPTIGMETLDNSTLEPYDFSWLPIVDLPEAKVSTLEEYFEILESIPAFAELVDAFYILPHSCFFEINWDTDGVIKGIMSSKSFIPQTPATPLPWISREITPNLLPLWGNLVEDSGDTLQHPLTVNSGWLPHENLYNIEQYDLYNYLGGTTLTPEEAIALTREEPEVVKEKVKTASDVLMYMMAARLVECSGCYCTGLYGDIWHWNMSAEEIMNYREAGCGNCANLANYLLEGDYEEVGFIDHTYRPGGGGGHIYNYILHEGKYYVVDFSRFASYNYDLEEDFIVPVLDSLEEWGKLGRQYYGGINTIITYTSAGRHLPMVYGDTQYFDQDKIERAKVFPASVAELYYPEDAEFTVLYQDKTGYKITPKTFDRAYYDWTLLKGGSTATTHGR